jgi:mono/diheme cytochrome c family protein
MTRKNPGSVILGVFCLSAAVWAQGSSNKPPQHDVKLIDSIRGPELYRTYCASCHGLDAKGNGPMAPLLKVRPGDLTRIAIRNRGVFPIMEVQKIISGEKQPNSGHGSREMPVWGPIFSQVTRDVDLGRVRIDNLSRYLRDIQVMK